jgi:DNA-binding MltR family transcriptional regulator
MEPKKNPDLFQLIQQIGRNGHAIHALLGSAVLEDDLAYLLAAQMPKLSKRKKDKLFTGYGPFASFSVKIDVAHAMQIITDDMRRNLHAIRAVRNKFAHPKDYHNFHSDEVISQLKKFPNYTAKKDPMAFFMDAIKECQEAMKPQLEHQALIKVVRTRVASKEKSS